MNISKLKVGRPEAQPSRPVDIDVRDYPDEPARAGQGPPSTVENVRHMLDANGVEVRYNVIKKRTEITVPWLVGTAENSDAAAMTHVLSLASRYNMPTGLVPSIVEAIGDENSYNPAADWIYDVTWDGQDRLRAICNTITPRGGYPLDLRDVLVRKWLLSATAAATLPAGFRCRGVLTLQGSQGLGKTSWVLSLINDERLRSKLIKVDHHMDAGNKDSLLGVIDHWLAELGEVESSFRRDISRLKGFLTSGTDKVRKPYGRVTVEYQRRTVFCATVNAHDFLVDDTGNNRWWTIPCVAIDHAHGIDMQQVFAQCAALLAAGEPWWLDEREERALERQNSLHRSFSVVRDRLAAVLDVEATDTSACPPFTATELLVHAGMENPSNGQAKEAASYLREWFGESKRYNGRDKWRVAIRSSAKIAVDSDDDGPAPQPRSKFD